MSPAPTVCAMPGCPVGTAGNFCTRHANLTPSQDQAEATELSHRYDKYDGLRRRYEQLKRDGAAEQEIEDAGYCAREAHNHLAELFGQAVEDIR